MPLLVTQAQQVVRRRCRRRLERVREAVEGWARARLGTRFPAFEAGLRPGSQAILTENWAALPGSLPTSVWSRGLALVNFVSLLLITPVVVFYLLVDWHPMLARLDSALPRDHAPTIRRLAADINDAVAAFIRGQGTICLVLGVFYAIGLSWAGIDYGLLVGLTTGLLAFIPFIGWLLGLIFASGLAIVQFWPEPRRCSRSSACSSAAWRSTPPSSRPRFVGQKIGLHPVWLIFALFVFSYLFGFVGTLVAVPLAAAIGVLVRFAVQLYLDSSVYKGSQRARRSALRCPSDERQGMTRSAPPACPRSRAPAGAGGGGLPRQPVQPGGRRLHRPLARLAARHPSWWWRRPRPARATSPTCGA